MSIFISSSLMQQFPLTMKKVYSLQQWTQTSQSEHENICRFYLENNELSVMSLFLILALYFAQMRNLTPRSLSLPLCGKLCAIVILYDYKRVLLSSCRSWSDPNVMMFYEFTSQLKVISVILTNNNSAGAQKSYFFLQSDSVAFGGVRILLPFLFVLHLTRSTKPFPAAAVRSRYCTLNQPPLFARSL